MTPLMKAEEVAACFAVRRETVYRLIKRGLLTSPVKVTDRASRWPEAEINAVVAARIAGKTDAQIKSLVQSLTKARQAADSPPSAA